MGRNDFRISVIRRATFGKEVREPICQSLEKTLSDATEELNYAVASNASRINDVSISDIPNETDYVMVTFQRANGT